MTIKPTLHWKSQKVEDGRKEKGLSKENCKQVQLAEKENHVNCKQQGQEGLLPKLHTTWMLDMELLIKLC